jgi:hypothetical protein
MSQTEANASKSMSNASLQVRVTPNVTPEALSQVLASIMRLRGCVSCGLLGVDLRITGDPAEINELKNIQGVQSVSMG